MHSKILPWDFFYKNKSGIDLKQKGIKSFVIEDVFLERLLKDKLPKNDLNLRIFIGNEVSKNFVEDNFFNMSLFSESSNYLILNAETIPLDSLTLIFNNLADYNDSFMFLFFQKTNKAILDLMKKSSLEVIEFDSPKPWDGPKLFQLILKELQINLPADIQKYILENVEHSSENFIELLENLKLNFGNEALSLEKIIPFVRKTRFDFFEELNDFHQNRRKFFKALESHGLDFEWMRDVSVSMQAHIVKVLNPDELRSKDRLNKYEQNIINWSEKETREELKKYLKFFSEIEILAKLKDQSIKEKIRFELI